MNNLNVRRLGHLFAKASLVSLVAVTCLVVQLKPLLAQSTLESLRGGETALIAIANEPPFMMLDADGTPQGIGPEIDKAVFAQMGIKNVKGQVMEYGAMIPAVQAHRVVLASGGALNMKPERCKAVLFSDPIICGGEGFVVRADLGQSVAAYKEVAARGLKIAVCGGCIEEKYALDAGIARDNIVIFPDNVSGLKMLLDKRIDVLASDATGMAHTQKTSSDPSLTVYVEVTDTPISCTGAVFSKDDGELRDAYNAGLKAIRANGEYMAILKKLDHETGAIGIDKMTTAQLCGE